MSQKKLPLIVICGPTGTGKTSLAIKLCQKFNGEIISADSRQVYKNADIGTNKIKNSNPKYQIQKKKNYWVQEGVKIHLYDVIEPDKHYSVAEFLKHAKKALTEIILDNKMPFLVGGTGFYIHTFLGETPYSLVKPNSKLRQRLTKYSTDQLFHQLKDLDPTVIKKMNSSDQKNKHRLIRYLEIAQTCGSLKKGMAEYQLPITNVQIIKIGLFGSRKYLYQKADTWTREIVENGLIKETQSLVQQYGENIPLLQGLIYQPTVQFIQGEIPHLQLIEKIQFQLHAYIRRQITWFKRDKQIIWFNIQDQGFDRQINKLIESSI